MTNLVQKFGNKYVDNWCLALSQSGVEIRI